MTTLQTDLLTMPLGARMPSLSSAGRLSAISASAMLAALLFTPPASAAPGDRIGDAVAIVNKVVADYDREKRTLAAGDDVRQDEVIQVNADAQGELKLDDETKLALGPGSRLVLDKFVYDSDKKAGSIVVDLAKGAFRFVTGIAAKSTYIIKTPNASITVRGTVFDVFIFPDKSVWLLLHEGAVEVTGRKSACRVLDQPGRLIAISKSGRVGRPVDWSKLTDPDGPTFDTAFPFIDKPPQIVSAPVLTRAAILNSALPDAPDQACINTKPPAKIQKATRDDDDGGGPTLKKPKAPKAKVKTVRVRDDAPPRKPTRVAKRPRNSDDWGNGVRGLDIVIGIGGGFGGGRRPGGRYPGRSNPN